MSRKRRNAVRRQGLKQIGAIMPKVEKIKDNQYQYQCKCGSIVILETDMPPDKLSLCWKCLQEFKKDEVIK